MDSTYKLNVDTTPSEAVVHDFAEYLGTLKLEARLEYDDDDDNELVRIYHTEKDGTETCLNYYQNEDGEAVLVVIRDDGRPFTFMIDVRWGGEENAIRVDMASVDGMFDGCVNRWVKIPSDNITWNFNTKLEDAESEDDGE